MRVGREPALAVAQQLADFGLADEVVLGRVEGAEQHVQVAEQRGHGRRAGEGQRAVAGRSPPGEARVQRAARDCDRPAERLEQAADEAAMSNGPRNEEDRLGIPLSAGPRTAEGIIEHSDGGAVAAARPVHGGFRPP